jgi:hypothetical protein
MPLLSDGSVEQLQLADSRAVMSATSVLIALDTPEEPADGCGLVWFTINPQRFVWRFLHSPSSHHDLGDHWNTHFTLYTVSRREPYSTSNSLRISKWSRSKSFPEMLWLDAHFVCSW